MTNPVQVPPVSVTPSIVRTIVPFLVGLVVTWLASRGLGLDAEMQGTLTAVITVVVGSAYYSVVRLIEQTRPKIGILLGIAKTPTYDVPDPADVESLEADLVGAFLREVDKDEAIDVLQAQIEGLVADLAVAKAPKKRAPRKAAAPKVAAPVVDGTEGA